MYRPKSLIIKNILSWSDVEFDFRQGKAVIIIGDNRDDEGQKGNGSGKSGLTECVVIAITGSVIRPIKQKEIVRRGCESGEVELTLYNAMLNTELKIWRKLYVGSKSGEYKMWENGKEMHESYSDANMFNALVFTMLGISKEDFYSFYVLEKTETPFLLMGDTEKKKVVNRFSGANKIDAAIPYVDQDVLEKDKKVRAIDASILTVKGKQELLSDQIRAEENRFSEEGKQEQIDEINGQIIQAAHSIREAQEELHCVQVGLKAKEVELKKIKLVDYTNSRTVAHNDIANVKALIKTAIESSDEITDRKKKAKVMLVGLQNSLAGLIECPKCSHEFKLEQEEDFDVQETRDTIIEVKEIMLEIDDEIVMNDKALQKLKLQKNEADATLDQIEKDEHAERDIKRRITNEQDLLERRLRKADQAIVDLEETTDKLEEKKKKVDDAESETLDKLTQQLMQYIDEETDLRLKLQESIDAKQEVEQWITHFKSFKSHLANKSIGNIQNYCNYYLQAMGSNIQIEIEGYKLLANKKLKEEITTTVIRNGVDTASYGTYSGGERGRIDICTIIALQTLINCNSITGGLDLLILDEVMDSVDSLGLENIIGALQNIDRTIMVVSQNEINSLRDHTIVIRKQNRISTIV